MEYASNGKANAALATGIVGTVLGVTNGGMGLLSGLTGNAGCNANCQSGSQMVNRYEMELIQQNTAKDSEIALLKADKYTDEKIVESYKDLQGQIKELSAEVRSNKEEQSQINMNQAVYNGTNTGAISCIQQQIAQLQGLTKLVVPNSSVCPGWGNVTITPTQTGTTVA